MLYNWKTLFFIANLYWGSNWGTNILVVISPHDLDWYVLFWQHYAPTSRKYCFGEHKTYMNVLYFSTLRWHRRFRLIPMNEEEPCNKGCQCHGCWWPIFWCRQVQFPDSKTHGPIWGPPGADRNQVGPMLAPWTLLSGKVWNQLSRNIPDSAPGCPIFEFGHK